VNILFITIGSFDGLNSQGIYPDLMREFIKSGHNIHIACANQNSSDKSYVDKQSGTDILRVSTGKITKTNVIRKGISTLLIETQYKNAIKYPYTRDKIFNSRIVSIFKDYSIKKEIN
jgi:hypothetical protein